MAQNKIIQVRLSLKEHGITRSLAQRRVRFTLVNDRNIVGDYCCGQAYVFIYNFEQLTSATSRDCIYNKLAEIRRYVGKQMMVITVLLDTTEPVLDVLSWVNLACGIELQCSILLCWSSDEAACYLDSLNSSFATSVEYGYNLQRDSGSIPQFIRAFTQIPQIFNRNDILRIVNRKKSIADILVSETNDFSNLPGFGTKKLSRLHTLLNTSFPTSNITISDVLHDNKAVQSFSVDDPNRQIESNTLESTHAKNVMNAAITKILCDEDLLNTTGQSNM